MEYLLAKQLKDAGFLQPLAPDDQYWLPSDAIDGSFEKCYDPSLEELIEACSSGEGTKFHNLVYYMYAKPQPEWGAFVQWYSERNGEPVFGKGSTPTEAVARLWLALNKK